MRKATSWQRFAIFSGALCLLFFGLWFTKSAETPPWRNLADAGSRLNETPPQTRDKPKAQIPSFRFVTYNVKNWLSSSQNPDKSPKSKRAVIELLATSRADVIGLSEIGDHSDVLEIQRMLKAAGLDLPHFRYTGGIDPIRHLALLSSFPVLEQVKPEIKISNTSFSMQRGILDLTLQIGDSPVRFIGLHLKSKRTVPNLDEAQLRVAEAMHVRAHVDRIFKQSPNLPLVVYGDFNDHPKSLSSRTIIGSYRSPEYLFPVFAEDSRSEKWTHFYDFQDSYSRIDLVLVSKTLKPRVDRKKTRILDPPNWFTASDHRAVLVHFE